jgi:chorismate lyase / 3-hydroxybenzoate synthase
MRPEYGECRRLPKQSGWLDDANMQPFSAQFSAPDAARTLLDDRHVLAWIEFHSAGDEPPDDPRRIAVGLPQLGSSPLVEVWTSNTPVESGRRGRIAFNKNEQILFGHLAVDERDFSRVDAAARAAYEDFLPFAGEMGFPHYLRIWNYIPDINGQENGVERYKLFCMGRHASLESFEFPEHRLPAASGVGSPPGQMLIYFLAARSPGIQIENPRQVSAFRYPPQYGPKSPAFSRAMFKEWGTDKHLYISGTASIVGHESQHNEDVLPQLGESLRNVSTLIDSARIEHGLPIQSPAELTQIKIYIRHEQDYEAIRRHIHDELGAEAPVIYLLGDLCREDLLVEVEGFYAT